MTTTWNTRSPNALVQAPWLLQASVSEICFNQFSCLEFAGAASLLNSTSHNRRLWSLCLTGIALAVVLPVLALVLLSVAAWYYRSYICLKMQAVRGNHSMDSAIQISPYPATYPTWSDANAQDQHAIWWVMMCRPMTLVVPSVYY